jgi:hypothetical protein
MDDHATSVEDISAAVAADDSGSALTPETVTSADQAPVVAGTPMKPEPGVVRGTLVDVDGERFYRVSNYDAMPPFFMSLVSDSDHWLFIASNGALTAGRRSPDHALFPYETDDRIYDSPEHTGPKTLLRVRRAGSTSLWEPFSQRYEGMYRISRNLYKSVFGNKIIFEEANEDLGLTFSYAWLTSERFGFVRRVTLANQSSEPLSLELLDGVQNLLPHGIEHRYQMEFSTLADGYKSADLEPETGLALIRMSAIPVDSAEPSEALRTTTVWSHGLEPATRLLSAMQVDRFRHGHAVEQEIEVRGRRGAYFLNASLELHGDERKTWYLVADVDQDAADVAAVLELLRERGNLHKAIEEDVARGTRNLVRVVASADGLQASEDELSDWRHFSNALFNVMRGGVPDRGYWISRSDLASYIGRINRDVARRQAMFLHSLPETLSHAELMSLVNERDDADLIRLVSEYLPLTFSRRHGDPSRPWNLFSIEIKDERGEKILNYQGNWRDIFQNWEALALSFPGYVESMVFRFLDASTIDGNNPYRISRHGFDWDRVDPDRSWGAYGYWGDHQVIYLLKLLEVSERYHPGAVRDLLTRRLFAYANVPYRIKPYAALLEDPRRTIDYDFELERSIDERFDDLGQDAKLVSDRDGICHANLTEKLLVVALSKLANFIPEAGIWMNTQRPEWNDANNALVGYGVSMVTLYYLRRFLAFSRSLFASLDGSEVEIAAEVAELFNAMLAALEQHSGLLAGPISDRDRKRILDALGGAGSDYRSKVYADGFSGEQKRLSGDELARFCDVALQHLDHSIRANRREDGLYHAYNLMKVVGDGIEIRRLDEMLEGQVAVLGSGALSTQEAIEVLDALRSSQLYRADQNSYILYPYRRLPSFLEQNNIPEKMLQRSHLLSSMVSRGDKRIVVRDVNGVAHFNAAFRNERLLKEGLTALTDEAEHLAEMEMPLMLEMYEEQMPLMLEMYEELFDHQSFTGRSGTFYKYEGLGCIYWHMVSKLLLAVQEELDAAVLAKTKTALLDRLRDHYHEIREGIGVHKSPELYGAIPTDPYSHTPSFAGVQQPGMTGQVKEDLISRFGEMGVRVDEGRLGFRAHLMSEGEFLSAPRTFTYYDSEGQERSIELPEGTFAFTTCQVPVVLHREGPARIELTRADGSHDVSEGLDLDLQDSTAIFERTGDIVRLDVFHGLGGDRGRGRFFRFKG